MSQSKTLEDFYTAYAKWLMRGAKEGNLFTRDQGLCNNLHKWVRRIYGPISFYDLIFEMRKQFEDAGLCELHPFHETAREYNQDSEDKTHHLNDHRLHWVANHCRDMQDK